MTLDSRLRHSTTRDLGRERIKPCVSVTEAVGGRRSLPSGLI